VGQTSQVADFTNVTFALSEENGATHQQLYITDRTTQPGGTANFNGVWDGQSVTGTLAYDDAGNVHITFSGDTASFDGFISGSPDLYHINGNFPMADGAQVPVAGDQTL
jgi:hypothetical protein